MIDSVLRRHYILPTEHGAWIWWIGPFLIGTAAAGYRSADLLVLAVAALAGFLLRQPATILVKAWSGRRPRAEIRPAAIWAAVDLVFLLLATAALVVLGHGRILILAVPGLAVFAWHMVLISRRDERGQMGVALIGSGVLALAAPAAYWVAGGGELVLPWLLWALFWLQSAASIVLVYYRLSFRRRVSAPALRARLADGRRTLLYHGFNAVSATALAVAGAIPGLMAAGFALMLLDALDALLRPPVGLRPTRIGIRQLVASALFVALSTAGFLRLA